MKNNILDFFKNKKIISFILSLLIFTSIILQKVIPSYSFISILLFIIINSFVYFQIQNNKTKYSRDLIIISAFFSLILIIGEQISKLIFSQTSNILTELLNIKSLLIFLGNMIVIYFVIKSIVPKAINHRIKKQKTNEKKVFIFTFFTTIIGYLPYYIIHYPGILTGDSIDELNMILGNTPLNDHHTVLHVLFMSVPFKLGKIVTNNINFCVGLIAIAQIILLAIVFAYTVSFLSRYKIPKYVLVVIVLYYAFFPINGYYSITLWKDIIFSAFTLLLTIECIKLYEKREDLKLNNTISFIVSSILVIFARNNAIYMYIILSLFTLGFFRKKLKVIIPMLLIVFTFYAIIKGPVYNALNIKKSASSEYIAIPLQQIGRMAYKNTKFTKSEKNTISKLINIKTLKSVYNPEIVDPIKFNSNYHAEEFEKNKMKYLKLWLKLCIKHPVTAVESYLTSTLGYWYPDVYIYPVTNKIEKNKLGIHRSSHISEKYVKKIFKTTDNIIPLLGFLKSIGFAFWLIFICIYITIKKSSFKTIYIFIPIIGIWITMLLATPVYAEFRYIYSAYLCIPVFFALIFMLEKNEKM